MNEIICQIEFLRKGQDLEKSSTVLLRQMKACTAVLIRTRSITILIFPIIRHRHILILKNLRQHEEVRRSSLKKVTEKN